MRPGSLPGQGCGMPRARVAATLNTRRCQGGSWSSGAPSAHCGPLAASVTRLRGRQGEARRPKPSVRRRPAPGRILTRS